MAKYSWFPSFWKKQGKRSSGGSSGIGLPRLDASFSTSDEGQPLFVGRPTKPIVTHTTLFSKPTLPSLFTVKPAYFQLPVAEGKQPSSAILCISVLLLLVSSALLCGAFTLYFLSRSGSSVLVDNTTAPGTTHDLEDAGNQPLPPGPLQSDPSLPASSTSSEQDQSQSSEPGSEPSIPQPGGGENLHGSGPGPQPNGAHGEYFLPSEEDTKILLLYQFYHTQEAWSHIHNVPPFRGICDYPQMVRPSSNDVDAPSLLPILQDVAYQGLLCEYGAMLTIDSHMQAIQGAVPWIGFQSWRATDRGIALSPLALHHLEEYVRANHRVGPVPDTNIFYYWVAYGPLDFYQDCDTSYGKCSHVFAAVFQELLNTDAILGSTSDRTLFFPANQEHLPPMPIHGRGFACCSYWLMHVDSFRRFMRFLRLFYVTLESLFHVHDNAEACPLGIRDQRESASQCWCFIMERLVNIWVYHTGHKMMFVDRDGSLDEQFPVPERISWADRFTSENLDRLERSFPQRLLPREAELYRRLGAEMA